MKTLAMAKMTQEVGLTIVENKNFKFIAKKAGLRQERRGGANYFIGRGRRWRINDQNLLQMGDCDFDRWANSVEVTTFVPNTVKDIIRLVRDLTLPK